MYLGVDVKYAALSVLTHAQAISTPAAADASNTGGPVEEGDAASAELAAASISPTANRSEGRSATAAEVVAPGAGDTAQDSVVAIQTGVDTATAEPSATSPSVTEPPIEDLINLTDEQRVALTVAYWTALDRYMDQEIENRISGIRDSGNLQLFDYLSCRAEGHKTALEAISKLSNRGVDAHVTAYAGKAREWHGEGAKLFARALDLLTDAPTAQLSGPFAQSWQSAATQHRMEERLLSEKHKAVRSYLDHSKRLEPVAEAPVPPAEAAP